MSGEDLRLAYGVKRLLEDGGRLAAEGARSTPGLHHWLLVLLRRYRAMAERMVRGLDGVGAARDLERRLAEGETGDDLPAPELLSRAARGARARGAERIAERDVAAAVLEAAGYEIQTESLPPPTGDVTDEPPGKAPAPEPAATRPSAYRPRASRPTPTLERLGRDLTRAAGEGRLVEVVGRDEELDLIVETLCRRTKRNPLLVGPAGVGKTAVVEGLAARIQRGDVPDALQGVRLLSLRPSVVIASVGTLAEFMATMEKIVQEASQDGILLFVDEAHSLVGAGGAQGSSDMAGLLKPALARGDIAVLGATTDLEYREFIQPDRALERRFQPIRVQELGREATLAVMRAHRDRLQALRGVRVPDPLLAWLFGFASEYLRNRYFPDKAVDLLEQCVAHAVANGAAEVAPEAARTVAQRVIGMPLGLEVRLQSLERELSRLGLLAPEEEEALLHRLEVTLAGFDVHSERPNAVLLLVGSAAARADLLAAAVAQALFGEGNRVVAVDLGRFKQEHEVSGLLGSPPGYVGYGEPGPLQPLTQMPWCVLLGRHVDACHPHVREVLAAGLNQGLLTTAQGERIFLSDAVVLLTVGDDAEREAGHLGFGADGGASQAEADRVLETLGDSLAQEVDLVCRGPAPGRPANGRWIKEILLEGLAGRYRHHGLDVEWDESVVAWLQARAEESRNQRTLERLLDEAVGVEILRYRKEHAPAGGRIVVKYENGAVRVARRSA